MVNQDMSVVETFNQAVDALKDLLEIEGIVVYDGKNIKYHDFKDENQLRKISKAIQAAKNNIGFDLGLDEVDIMGEGSSIKIYFDDTRAIIIKIQPGSPISDSILEEKAKAIFQFIE